MYRHDPAPPASRLMVHGSSTLRRLGWESLLHVWSTLLDYYDHPADAPREVAYWYGERALCGLLAAAAWKLPSGWSLQEVAWEAAHGQRGCTDLWLGFERHQFAIEAKPCWLDTPDPGGGRWSQDVQTALWQACAQLNALPLEYRVGSPVALAFLVPAWPIGSGEMAETHVAQRLTAIAGALVHEGTLLATSRCRTDHAWPTATHDAQRWVYPSVIVAGQSYETFAQIPTVENSDLLGIEPTDDVSS